MLKQKRGSHFVNRVFRMRLNMIDLDRVRVAGLAVRDAAGDDDAVAVLEVHMLFGELLCRVEQHLRRRQDRAHDGRDRPGQGELSPGALVRRQAHDVHGRAEAGDKARRDALPLRRRRRPHARL